MPQPRQPVEKVNYRPMEVPESKPVKMAIAPKVSATFAESLPLYSNFINLYGKSFANVKR